MKNRFLVLAAIFAAIVMAGCASGGGGSAASSAPEEPPPPPGTERLALHNGAYAIYRFDLPAGATWSDYDKITAEYMVDAENLAKQIRMGGTVRLMGNYKEDAFGVTGPNRYANLAVEGSANPNGPYIMDNIDKTWEFMGAVADQWFTVEYDISGTKGHGQFNRNNVPAPDAAGPFFFGIGIPSEDGSRARAIVQLVRNITLHHATDDSLSVVSKGSGFEEPTFVTYMPIVSTRVSNF